MVLNDGFKAHSSLKQSHTSQALADQKLHPGRRRILRNLESSIRAVNHSGLYDRNHRNMVISQGNHRETIGEW